MAQLENVHVMLTGTITAKNEMQIKKKMKALAPAMKHYLPLLTYLYLAIVNFLNLIMRCS